MEDRLLNSREVGVLLGLPEATVRKEWRRWGLKGYRIGRALRFRESAVNEWIDRRAAA